jgi:hypothetical protein
MRVSQEGNLDSISNYLGHEDLQVVSNRNRHE